MRSWGVHLIAICGGAGLLLAARSLQEVVVDPRTLTHSWGYFFLAGALQVLAGFLVLAPVLWPRLRGERVTGPRWGLVILYLAAGLLLVSAHPLQMGLYRAGLRGPGDWLRPLATTASLGMFGAFLIAVGVAYALGRQQRGRESSTGQ